MKRRIKLKHNVRVLNYNSLKYKYKIVYPDICRSVYVCVKKGFGWRVRYVLVYIPEFIGVLRNEFYRILRGLEWMETKEGYMPKLTDIKLFKILKGRVNK